MGSLKTVSGNRAWIATKKLHRFWSGLLAYGSAIGLLSCCLIFCTQSWEPLSAVGLIQRVKAAPMIRTDQAMMNYRELDKASGQKKTDFMESHLPHIVWVKAVSRRWLNVAGYLSRRRVAEESLGSWRKAVGEHSWDRLVARQLEQRVSPTETGARETCTPTQPTAETGQQSFPSLTFLGHDSLRIVHLLCSVSRSQLWKCQKWESEKSFCETVKVHHQSGTCRSNNNCDLQSEGVYSTKKQDLFPSRRHFLKTGLPITWPQMEVM